MSLLQSQTDIIKLMGNRFEFTACHRDESLCKEAVIAAIQEVQRNEKLMTTYSEDSYTAQINQNAGLAPVFVPEELAQLIVRSKRYH